MGDWFGYSPSDFLMFSQEAYRSLFERANHALWPLPVAAPMLGLAVFLTALRRPWGTRVALAALAAAWASVAGVFLPLYAEISWAIGYLVPAFWTQAAMLALAALFAPVARSGAGCGAREVIGCAAVLTAVLLWPLNPLASGSPIGGAEVIGIAPDPTALATLGILTHVKRGAMTAILAIAPAAWLAVSCVTLLTMGAWQGSLIGVAAGAGCIALALPQRRE